MTALKTCTIEQAMAHIQALPIDKQESIFDYIDFLANQNQHVQKRQFGLYQGKGNFKLSDDWEISEEELLGL